MAELLLVQPFYEAGGRFHLEVETLRERDGESRRRIEHVELRVLEADEDRILLAWLPRWIEVLEGPVDAPPIGAELAEELSRLWFEVALGEAGVFVGISNEVDVKEKLGRLCTALLDGMLWAGDPQHQAAKNLIQPELLFQRAQRDVALWFGAGGKSFPVDEPMRLTQDVPNAVTGGMLPAEFELKANYHPEQDEYTVLCEQISHAGPLLERIAALGEPGTFAGVDFAAARLFDLTEYVIDAEHGWPRTVRFTRRSNIPQVNLLDFTEIRLRDQSVP